MKKIIYFALIFTLASCGSFRSNYKLPTKVQKTSYDLKDKDGSFVEEFEVKYYNKSHELKSKRKLYSSSDSTKKILEKSIAISEYGRLGKVNVLRPKISQFHIWFDQKRYSTELIMNKSTKSFDVKLRSPEKKWNGNQSIKFPKGTGLYCFYSQMGECVSSTGFIDRAIKSKGGELNFHIVWEGYPYFMEQYVNMPPQLFSKASLNYDGALKNNENRFVLNVAGQSIFLIFGKNNVLNKILWVAQGYTKIKVDKK